MTLPTILPTWLRFRRTRIFGARIYVHWSVLVVVALLTLVSIRSPLHAAVAIASYLGIIVIHEAGHAWVAHRLGYRVDAIHVSFLHGYCTHDMPYNEGDHVFIAWGGVGAQIVIAIPVLAAATIFDRQDFGYAAPAIAFLGYVNLVLALVNLAPAPGFDGQIAWRALALLWNRATRSRGRRF